ncbi:FAD:protein FMN transferase [Marinobacter halophilus]|uniref:FAD:protein FMN transferase n=1 Tax=Marinobacter halophilus TaxID=1323740 RepID=A0A2T1K986_9GAMM|nr:FAD:protein FMN transferase [Marinobacter halophilus]PSF06709.1 FAD:protein FMN transferase ApbE [Marinobacter halophilus]GGC74888.1 thiamin biosynthesis lipoprotein ApbE [Marinobacter halophilus]
MTSRMFEPARVVMASVLWILVVVALAGCSFQDEEQIWEISGGIFGTTYHINVVLPEDEARLQTLAQGIRNELDQVDATMSTWKNDSELSRLNQKPDQSEWTALSQPLFEVIQRAQEIAELTGGAFDVTIGPVVNLWGFGPDARPVEVPSESELDELLAVTGYQYLELDAATRAVRSTQPQYIDLSGIAKGYAVDVVARYLDSEGVGAYLVEIGGEVRVNGRKPEGGAWRLAIEEPSEQARQVNKIVAMDRQAMATSGDYRNYYESEGRRYSHTIDPATGKPVTNKLASVTVIAEDSMTADALATAFTVMGYDKAMSLATRENLPAYFIVRGEGDFVIHQTPAFSSYVVQ